MADQLSEQQVWDEEASKLDAGTTPAVEVKAPEETLPPVEAEVVPPTTEVAPEPEDPLAGLSEGVRAKLAQIDELAKANAQLLHHVKTAEGRVASLQREFQVARAAQQHVAPQDAPTQGQIASAAKSPEKWEQLKADYPEWSDGIEAFVSAKLDAIPKPQAGLTPEQVAGYVQQQVALTKEETARLIAEARVEGKYEDWKETVNSTDFVQWLGVQTPDVRALADSSSAKDAIRLLDMFQDAKKRPAAEIRQERGARLAAAATTRPGTTPPPKTVGDMTAEELWNFEAAKREKTRAQRGY